MIPLSGGTHCFSPKSAVGKYILYSGGARAAPSGHPAAPAKFPVVVLIPKARQDELRAAGWKVFEIHSLEEMQQVI